jgi:hypothetical protein
MPKVQGLKLSISDHPGDTDWMCGPVNGVSVYIVQINRVNPDTEAEWKYVDSSTKSSRMLTGLASVKGSPSSLSDLDEGFFQFG